MNIVTRETLFVYGLRVAICVLVATALYFCFERNTQAVRRIFKTRRQVVQSSINRRQTPISVRRVMFSPASRRNVTTILSFMGRAIVPAVHSSRAARPQSVALSVAICMRMRSIE